MAIISPRTLPILSCSFGTSSEESSRDGVSVDRYLQALKILRQMQTRSSAVSGLLRKNGRRCPSRFAVPLASHPDGSTWTRPPRLPCAPASTASSSVKIERRFMGRVAQRVRVGLSHPQEAAARRLGASAQEAQSGAARPRREHVGLGRQVSSSECLTSS